jgi:hypothetical protein
MMMSGLWSLRAGRESAAARAAECADLDGGPGAVGKLDTGVALSGGRSVGAHGGAGAEGRDGVAGERAAVHTGTAAHCMMPSWAADGASSSGGLHFVLFRSRSERVPRLAFHFERGCCSFCTRASWAKSPTAHGRGGGRSSRVLFRRGGCTEEPHYRTESNKMKRN